MTRLLRSATAAVIIALSACNPAPPHAPISDLCEAEIRNDTDVALFITAFGRDKIELGRVEPGEVAILSELCRVERVPVRGTPADAGVGSDPVWEVVVFWAGETVRVSLGR
jgi:hypothetical protein